MMVKLLLFENSGIHNMGDWHVFLLITCIEYTIFPIPRSLALEVLHKLGHSIKGIEFVKKILLKNISR